MTSLRVASVYFLPPVQAHYLHALRHCLLHLRCLQRHPQWLRRTTYTHLVNTTGPNNRHLSLSPLSLLLQYTVPTRLLFQHNPSNPLDHTLPPSLRHKVLHNSIIRSITRQGPMLIRIRLLSRSSKQHHHLWHLLHAVRMEPRMLLLSVPLQGVLHQSSETMEAGMTHLLSHNVGHLQPCH